MKKEKINNIELQRLVTLKCDKLDFEDVTDEEIDKISEITLQGKLINGKTSGIGLENILNFVNLTSLSLSDYNITQSFIKDLIKLKKIERLSFLRCSFEEIDFKDLGDKLRQISFIGCYGLNFDYPKLKQIQIAGSEVDFKKINFANVENVFIVESIVKNAQNLIEYENIKNIILDGSILFDSNGQEIQDIMVSKNTVYTHKAEYKVYDHCK